MMDGDASVVSSSEGKTVAILSNNLLSASFSIVVELPPVSPLSTTSKSTTTLVKCSIIVYTQYRALWPGESFQPSPHRHTPSKSLKAFLTSSFISPHTSSMTGAAQCFWNRMKVFLLMIHSCYLTQELQQVTKNHSDTQAGLVCNLTPQRTTTSCYGHWYILKLLLHFHQLCACCD